MKNIITWGLILTCVFGLIGCGKYYIEQPYQGIYTTDVDIDALIKGVE